MIGVSVIFPRSKEGDEITVVSIAIRLQISSVLTG